MSEKKLKNAPKYRPNGRIFNLLREFETLRDNWDEDVAIAPDSLAIAQARYVTQVLENAGQPVFSAAPGPNGEVMLDLRNPEKSRSVEIIFYPERSTAVYFPEEVKRIPFQKEFDLTELSAILEWLNQNNYLNEKR
jgi:hypothetical protein